METFSQLRLSSLWWPLLVLSWHKIIQDRCVEAVRVQCENRGPVSYCCPQHSLKHVRLQKVPAYPGLKEWTQPLFCWLILGHLLFWSVLGRLWRTALWGLGDIAHLNQVRIVQKWWLLVAAFIWCIDWFLLKTKSEFSCQNSSMYKWCLQASDALVLTSYFS